MIERKPRLSFSHRFLFEFEPHSEHVSTVGRTYGADGVWVVHLALILRVGEHFFYFVLKFTHEVNMKRNRVGCNVDLTNL